MTASSNDSPPEDPFDLPEGDDLETPSAHRGSHTVLPPRKSRTERSEAVHRPSAGPHGNVGLRIESHIGRRPTPRDEDGLLVQEISSSVVRLEQAPPPQKVPRIPVPLEKPTPAEDQHDETTSEQEEWGGHKLPGKRWLVPSAIAVLALIVGSLILLPFINRPNEARAKSASQTFRPVEEEKVSGIDALNRLIPRQPEAEHLFHTFATARVFDDLLPILRDAASIENLARPNWHALPVPLDWSVPSTVTWRVTPLGNKVSGILEGSFPNFTPFSAYFVEMDNHLLLDWKATTAYSTARFESLIKGEGDASEIRGVLTLANFYTAVWPEEEFQSFQFTAPGGESYIWCYARRGSPQEAGINRFLKTSEIIEDTPPPQRATLKLERSRDDAAPNQWQIAELLHIDWINP